LGAPKLVRDRYREDGDWKRYTDGLLEHLKKQRAAIAELSELVLSSNRVLLGPRRRLDQSRSISATALVLRLALLLSSSCALAQRTVGELIDAGATRLSPAEFRDQVVQRTIRGPMETGMDAEIMYGANGSVEGTGGEGYGASIAWTAQILGTWKFGDDGTVCSAISLDGATIRASFPMRCRYWFNLNNRYYVSNSASNRSAAVLSRAIAE